MDRDFNAEPLTSAELAAMELHQQLIALSPPGDDTALRLTIRLGDGRHVADVKLSARDVEALNDALVSLNAYRADLEADTAPTGAEDPAALPAVDDAALDAALTRLENLANGETS